jgi:hypothetical protein
MPNWRAPARPLAGGEEEEEAEEAEEAAIP